MLTEKNIETQWRYYNDGKAWLCKVVYKKKTVFWLSAWDGYFRTSFFFMERTIDGVLEVNISDSAKESMTLPPSTGKLLPLIFDVREKSVLQDIAKVIDYKISIK